MSTPEPGVNQSEKQDEIRLPLFLVTYGRMTGIAAALALFVIFALGAWYALYEVGVNKPITARIPLIKADPGPLKVKPKHPGGLKIPNQDKLVFERITPEIRTAGVEKLAPEPEEPIATNDVSTGNTPPQDSKRLIIPQSINKLKPLPTSPIKIIANKTNADPAYQIQLAAFRKEDQAKASWVKLKKNHAEILEGLMPITVRVDLGKKGVYFRVQAGYFNDLKAARSTCDKLKEKGQGCIIKRPN